jgi:serine/threonine protein kinase
MLTSSRQSSQWRDILFEIRALLHEPLRYHPNIVRLLDIGWAASAETGSSFPQLVLEYADHGTFDHLQRSNGSALPFRIKQKLCYDIGRGLSIIHACGIIHGDLKHENVLIFRNQYDVPGAQPYTAKLSDFGGAVIDLGSEAQKYTLPMGTIPYNAPEMGEPLTAQGLRLTDAFSFGMLVWRAFLDCEDLCVAMGLRTAPGRSRLSLAEEHAIHVLKASDMLVAKACESASAYRKSQSLPLAVLSLINSVLTCTLNRDPEQRTLVEAQMLLRGMGLNDVVGYVKTKDMANETLQMQRNNATPGKHGLDLDSIGYGLGRHGDHYDAQNNLPGYRPDLPPPAHGQFLFEPLKLKSLLSWNQQCDIVRELETMAGSAYNESATDIQPWNAAFYIFQAHLANFGVHYDPTEACQWLLQAADAKEETATTDYLAQAWYTRVCRALDVNVGVSIDKQFEYLSFGILRGHQNCLDDTVDVMSRCIDEADKSQLMARLEGATQLFRKMTGGTGMPYFVHRKLRREYQFNSLDNLDAEIRNELGDKYEASLRASIEDATNSASTPENAFDKVYVNPRDMVSSIWRRVGAVSRH